MMANVLAMNAAKKTVINRIEPTNWYVGMKNPTVQLMVYGQGIRDVGSVTTDYPGVTIDSLVRLDSSAHLPEPPRCTAWYDDPELRQDEGDLSAQGP